MNSPTNLAGFWGVCWLLAYILQKCDAITRGSDRHRVHAIRVSVVGLDSGVCGRALAVSCPLHVHRIESERLTAEYGQQYSTNRESGVLAAEFGWRMLPFLVALTPSAQISYKYRRCTCVIAKVIYLQITQLYTLCLSWR
ncbi:hypothetical protein B0T24DRAFT_624509 [Lasiosphaeria ovina]|uniref:Secreted protein n=1 Tax=Lasiosphaeria ovina TaxID=92902 RepID=A0AAE0N8V5_9PEZI|nr:hypothetical protein B0T24DRAFT_624509 [Lasiosphaeria ovina]